MIVDRLHELGVGSGDVVGLHSSMPSLGKIILQIHKAGGEAAVKLAVNEVIEAFLDVLGGQQGLLVVPTFSFCFAGKPNEEVYEPHTTPSKVGLLTEVLLRRPDAQRSNQPTHSVAAIGMRARQLIRDHDQTTPIGVDSPFHRLARWGGWICYLGTTSKTLSLLHLAEVLADVPHADTFCYGYLGWHQAGLRRTDDGGIETLGLREIPGCSESFGRFDALLEEAGALRTGRLYRAPLMLFRAQQALDLAVQKLKAEPFWLLCPAGSCQACDMRRAAHHCRNAPI